MSKRTKNIKGVSTGILNSLEAINQEEQVQEVKKEVPKEEKVEKFKRSYMLTEDQIDRVLLLKMKRKVKDYSIVVGEAIDFYYEHITRKDE